VGRDRPTLQNVEAILLKGPLDVYGKAVEVFNLDESSKEPIELCLAQRELPAALAGSCGSASIAVVVQADVLLLLPEGLCDDPPRELVHDIAVGVDQTCHYGLPEASVRIEDSFIIIVVQRVQREAHACDLAVDHGLDNDRDAEAGDGEA